MMKRALRRSVWISIIAALTLSQQAFAYDVVTNVITTSTSSSSGSTSGPTTTNSVRGSYGPGYTAQTGYQATTTGGTYYQTPYTTTYTGAPTAYTLNGVTYNTVLTGPGTGLISGNTTAGLTPGVMNPAGFKYSTSSSVVNARYVIVNTYAHTGWQFDAAGMWYLNENGTYPVSCWQQIDGSFYHFNAYGYLEVETFVYESNGHWYYVGPDGKMARGWTQIGADYLYFMPDNGQLVGPGLQLIDGKYYYILSNGRRAVNAWIGGQYYGADGARV